MQSLQQRHRSNPRSPPSWPGSWLTLLAQVAGFTPGWVNLISEKGQRLVEHFGDRQGKLIDPHFEIIEQSPEHFRVGITLPDHVPEAYVDHVARLHPGRVDSVERQPAPKQWATANLTVNLNDLAALTAKVALCTGALRWGDEFLLSDLATCLREGVFDPTLLAAASAPVGPLPADLKPVISSALNHSVTTSVV